MSNRHVNLTDIVETCLMQPLAKSCTLILRWLVVNLRFVIIFL